MKTRITRISLAACAALAIGACGGMMGSGGGSDMSFFITSVGSGKGADLGGLAGADKHCQSLAQAAGAGGKTWRAYLSTQGKTTSDTNVVHARDRIGKGPWYNAKGVRVARNVDDLHSASNNVTKETALNERGQVVAGRGDKPANRHDILTGTRPDGSAYPSQTDMTCGNWTKSGSDGTAIVGHHDRAGPVDHPWAVSWNSSHNTVGCSQPLLIKTGGDGLFYCFAAN
jgi:hypothetical protein